MRPDEYEPNVEMKCTPAVASGGDDEVSRYQNEMQKVSDEDLELFRRSHGLWLYSAWRVQR